MLKKGMYVLCLLVLISCSKYEPELCSSGPVVVYKIKPGYEDMAQIQLSENLMHVTCFPGKYPADELRAIPLANGYYLQRVCGNAVLSISLEQYLDGYGTYSVQDLFNMVIDTKPFTEKYECCELINTRDTSVINKLIRDGQLKNCRKLH
jgi:hypothetical protein